MSPAEPWVVLARVLRPQGRRGEVLAELFTDFPEKLVSREGLYLAKEGFSGAAEEARSCRLVGSWMPRGRNEGRIVLELEGVSTIEEAEALAGFELLVSAGERAALDEGAAYVSDLVGCSVYDGEQRVGTVREVQFPTSPDGRRRLEQATPLLLVDLLQAGSEAMIPFAKEFLREVDLGAKVLRMALPEGLLELGAADGDAPVPGEDEPAPRKS